jgi:glycosyltransferase involved in cell wall biosynthesis
MRKKIVWLTAENFVDVDIPIVPEIAKTFHVDWYIVFSNNKVTNFSEDWFKNKFKLNQLKIVFINNNQRLISLKTLALYINLIKTIKNNRYDIIYVNMLGLPYLFLLIYFTLDISKVVYAAHDVVPHKKLKHGFLIKLYRQFIYKTFKNFHIFSIEQYKDFTKNYINKNILFAPLCLKNFGSSTLAPPDNKTIFLFFGIIRENKGVDCLIKATNLIADELANKIKVVIAGNCFDFSKYERLISNKNIFDLRIEVIPNESIPDLFAMSHFVILPYTDITQSGVLHIAFNYHKPIICSDLPGFHEYIIEGKNGFFFNVDDYFQLSEIMKNVILLKEEYPKIINNVKDYVNEHFSINKTIANYIEYLGRL